MYSNIEEAIGLVKSFEDRTLAKPDWTHAAHLTVALFYCMRFPFGVAVNLMRDGIHWLNDAHGVENSDTSGYHETLTIFWMIIVKQFVETSPRCNFSALANELIATCNDPKLPLEYYSRALLFSREARATHVQPDLNDVYLIATSAKLAAQVGGYECAACS